MPSRHGGSRTAKKVDLRKTPPFELAAFKQRVHELVAEGLSKLEIARRLGVSPTTLHERLRRPS